MTFTLLLFLVIGMAAAGFWYVAGRLASPVRQPLTDHHRNWLAHPDEHGLRIERAVCLDGRVPCLVVEPDAAAGPGERGRLLRRQLMAQGVAPEAYGATRGTLVLFHGRRSRKESLIPVAERFCAAGFRCLLPDLPAHGDSPIKVTRFGNDPFESRLGQAILAELAAARGFENEPAGLWGMSMGGAYAVRAAAASSSPWHCMIIVGSFDNLQGVVEDRCRRMAGPFGPLISSPLEALVPWRGGTRFSEVRPDRWANSVRVPVMVAHGDVDRLIDIDRGRALHDSFASETKRWVAVDGGTHGRVLVTPMPLYATMAAWFVEHL